MLGWFSPQTYEQTEISNLHCFGRASVNHLYVCTKFPYSLVLLKSYFKLINSQVLRE